MEEKVIKRELLEDLIKNTTKSVGMHNLRFTVESLLEKGVVTNTKEAKQLFSVLLKGRYLSGYYSNNVLWKNMESYRSEYKAVLNVRKLGEAGEPLAIFLVENLIDKYNLEYEFKSIEKNKKNKKKSECEKMVEKLAREYQQPLQQQVLTPAIQELSKITTDKNQELWWNYSYAIQDPNLLPQLIQRKK